MSEDKLIFDFSEVTCGLVPAILAELEKAGTGVVEFKIRQGIRTEIVNGFGTGGDWEFSIAGDLACDVARFSKKVRDKGNRLDILSF